jgi:hypothetical protein
MLNINILIYVFIIVLITIILYMNKNEVYTFLIKYNINLSFLIDTKNETNLIESKINELSNNHKDIIINDNFENLLDNKTSIVYNNFGNNNRLNKNKMGPIHNFHERFLRQPEEGWNKMWRHFNQKPINFIHSNDNNDVGNNYLKNMGNVNNIYKYVEY